jgi:transposase-like protein
MKKLRREIEPLIVEHRGNIAAVARALGVDRSTVWDRVKANSRLQKVLTEARETMIDSVESKLYDKALEGDVVSMIFFLKTQGRARGYSDRMELTGADGKELKLESTVIRQIMENEDASRIAHHLLAELARYSGGPRMDAEQGALAAPESPIEDEPTSP